MTGMNTSQDRTSRRNSICLSKCRHLNPGLEIAARLPAVDDEDEGTLHPDQPELVGDGLPGQVDVGEVRLRDGHSVSYDDSLARTEVVESHHQGCPALVDHDEGEGDRVLRVNTAYHNAQDHLQTFQSAVDIFISDQSY